jgi:general secretion pathway protein F
MAAVYPALILITLIIASVILFIYILPTMMVLTWWIELPPLTQLLFDIRDVLLNYWLFILLFLIVFIVTILVLIQWYQWRLFFHRVLLILPWINQLLKARIEMQIAKILEFSSSAWMTPLEKVNLLYNWVNNLVYKEYFKEKIRTIEMWGKLISVFSIDNMFWPQLQWYIETWDLNKNLDDLMRVHYNTTLNNIQKNVKMVQTLMNAIIIFLLWWVVWIFAWWILQLVLELTQSVL